MSNHPPLRDTITQALADTVVDDSEGRPGTRSALDTSELPGEGDVVGGLYRLVRLLGEGMFGKVYVAERIDVREHQVALKLMPREMYSGRNVERELVMLAAAGHPNIVQLKDHGTTDRYVWFTTPVYEGETLAMRLERGTLELREAYEIFLPIARGIEALHRAGLRHQDLKPENMYLARFAGRLHPIILDLGVAAERGATFVAGTLLYAAPEQVEALTGSRDKEIKLDEKMDTYSLAATLLLALVGREHFPGMKAKKKKDIWDAHRERGTHPLRVGALPELEDGPRDLLEDAFRLWFAIDPTQRPSVSELAEHLDVLLEKEREEARQEARKQARQRTTILRFRIGAGAVVLLSAGIIAWGYTKRETLELANELQQARAEGEASFDKLETCVAAHEITDRDLKNCRALRNRDRADFQKTLGDLSRTGSAAEEYAAQIMTYTARLKTCEEEAETEAKACAEARTQLTEQFESTHKQLEAELNQQRELAEARSAELNALTDQLLECRAGIAAPAATGDNPYVAPPQAPPIAAPTGSAPLPGEARPAPSAPVPTEEPPTPPDDDNPYP